MLTLTGSPRVIPNPKNIRSFPSAVEFERWLSKHHDRENQLWIRVYKKDSDRPTVTIAEALDVVLCWGWIDGLRKTYDESSFLQRYSPRKPKSVWSRINRENVARLTTAGRMTPHGQKHIDAARADGRGISTPDRPNSEAKIAIGENHRFFSPAMGAL
jgi:uncharacterized protein YdeI (YjbR/CyaY-like superfamily)